MKASDLLDSMEHSHSVIVTAMMASIGTHVLLKTEHTLR